MRPPEWDLPTSLSRNLPELESLEEEVRVCGENRFFPRRLNPFISFIKLKTSAQQKRRNGLADVF